MGAGEGLARVLRTRRPAPRFAVLGPEGAAGTFTPLGFKSMR